MRKRLLYLGWLGHGNAGDDLLFSIFREMAFCEAMAENISLVIDISRETHDFSLYPYDLVVLGGGSLLVIPYYLGLCRKAKSLLIPVAVWGSGFDLRDGAYTKFVLESFFSGKPLRPAEKLTSVHDEMMEVVQYAEIAGVRGELTRYVLCSDSAQVIGDPGLTAGILDCREDAVPGFDDFARGSAGLILVNWGTADNHLIGGDEQLVLENLSIALRRLLARGYKAAVYPVCGEDTVPCEILARSVNHPGLFLVDKVSDVCGILHMIERCRFSINLKLHANVLSAALNKPFIALGYGLKCFDFAHSVNALDLVLPTDRVSYGGILERAENIEKNYGQIQDRIRQMTGEYRKRQSAFMKGLVSLLER